MQLRSETRDEVDNEGEDSLFFRGRWPSSTIAFRRVIEPKPVVVGVKICPCCARSVDFVSKCFGRDIILTITGEDIKAEWVE